MTVSISARTFRAARGKVFVSGLDHGVQTTAAGIIIPDDNMTERGVRPRWGQVWAVGEAVDDLVAGEWVLVEHARWTQGLDLTLDTGTVRVWMIDYPAAVLLASDVDPRQAQRPTAMPLAQNRFQAGTEGAAKATGVAIHSAGRRPEIERQPWQKGSL